MFVDFTEFLAKLRYLNLFTHKKEEEMLTHLLGDDHSV